jgi:hypothetical protein
MPIELKSQAHDMLNKYNLEDKYLQNCIDTIKQRLNQEGNPIFWGETLNIIKSYNNIRSNNLEHIIPALFPYLK